VNDDELRVLVREAIKKHLGDRQPQEGVGSTEPVLINFSRYKVQRVSDDGMCLIEPAVRCNQCGYCECHGH
jgi:hypothetical protein